VVNSRPARDHTLKIFLTGPLPPLWPRRSPYGVRRPPLRSGRETKAVLLIHRREGPASRGYSLTYRYIFFLVSALEIGAPESEWILPQSERLPYRDGAQKFSMVFRRFLGGPEKQKTRSCRAQELSRSCAQWRGWERRQWTQTTLSVKPRTGGTGGKTGGGSFATQNGQVAAMCPV